MIETDNLEGCYPAADPRVVPQSLAYRYLEPLRIATVCDGCGAHLPVETCVLTNWERTDGMFEVYCGSCAPVMYVQWALEK